MKKEKKVMSKNFDLEAEKFILSAILEKPEIFLDIQKKLTSYEMFYGYEHKLLYDAMLHLFNTDNTIDHIMLINALKTKKTYNDDLKLLISKLKSEVNDVSSYDEKIYILLNKWRMRLTERMTERIQKVTASGNCSFNEVKEIMEKYAYLDESNEFNSKTVIQILRDETEINNLLIQKGEKHKYHGIPTSFESLRKYLVYRRKNITIIGGRPANGKTSFALKEARFQAKEGFRVLFFTLEMGVSECCVKLICMDQGIEYSFFESMPLADQNTMNRALEQKMINNKEDLVFNDFSFTLREISDSIKSLHKTKPVDIVYIDYVQFILGPDQTKENRNNELAKMSRTFKMLSSKLNFAMVLLSQLNRKCEEREDKRPMLSDLRDSGALESDASITLALYNGAVYNDPVTIENQIELLFLKSRFGPIGRRYLYFKKEHMLFTDIVDDPLAITNKTKKAKKKEMSKSKFKPNFKIGNSLESRNSKVPEGKQQEAF